MSSAIEKSVAKMLKAEMKSLNGSLKAKPKKKKAKVVKVEQSK